MQIALAGGTDHRLRTHRRLWTVAVWSLAFALPVWLWTTPASADEPASAALVRSYLEAIGAGDVDRALDIADRHPPGDGAAFLTSAALDPDWVVNSVVSDADEDFSTSTTVEVVITTGDGVSATGEFALTRDERDDDWTFEDPLIVVSFAVSPLWYAEVNGLVVPYAATGVDIDPYSSDDLPSFYLLPGAYRFYSDVPGLVDFPDAAVPLLPGSHGALTHGAAMRVDPSPLPLVPEAEGRIQSAVDDLVDECAAMAAKSVAGCPFGVRYVLDPRDHDNYILDYRDPAWKVTKQPVIAAVPTGDWITITFREAGSAEFSAVGLEEGREVAVTMTCPIEPDSLNIGILAGGELRLVTPWVRFAEEIDRDPTLWETC